MLGWGNPAIDKHAIQEGVEIILVVSCCRNRGKLRPDGPLGSHADLGFYALYMDNAANFVASVVLSRNIFSIIGRT